MLALIFVSDAYNVLSYYGTFGQRADIIIEEQDTTHIDSETQGATLLDSRGFTKPPRFDGRQEHWAAWAFRVESFASLCDSYDYMDQARQASLTIDSTSCVGDAVEVAKSLYHFLVQTVDGRALQLIHLVQRGNGLEACRVLCREYQPAVCGRFANTLRNILNPKQWQSSVDFRESLISWDHLVLEFEQQSTEKISETLKIAIILEHAPTRIAESLRLSGPDVRDNYPAMRDAMRCLYESTRRVLVSPDLHRQPQLGLPRRRQREREEVQDYLCQEFGLLR